MSEQSRNLLAAMLAILLLAMLLSPPRQGEPASLPNTEDKNANGYYVLSNWLEASGYRVASHRRRLDALTQTQGVLWLTLPTSNDILQREYADLAAWLMEGNQLVLVVQSSIWSDMALREFLQGLGIELLEAPVVEGEEVDSPDLDGSLLDSSLLSSPVQQYESTSSHPLFADVETIELRGAIELMDSEFDASVQATPLFTRTGTSSSMAWLLQTESFPQGIFVFGHDELFSNQGLRESQSQTLTKNLVSNFVSRHQTIVFDDFHHGLSDLYDIQALLGDSRFQVSAVAVLLLWFAYVALYNVRLGPVLAARVRYSNREFSVAASSLYARHSDDDEVNAQLIKTFNNTYRGRHGLPRNGRSVTEHMQANHVFDTADINSLVQLETHLEMDPMKVQHSLHNLYSRLESI